jgi:phage tail sheath protein FI
MAVNVKTPGVYIDEIPVLPGSVAGVATAVPAFIGYVEKAEMNGVLIQFNTPIRITSMLEYETIFGKAPAQFFGIDIDDNTQVSPTVRNIVVTKTPEPVYKMYYGMQMYFSNGGGPCYIVPVGIYSGTVAKADVLAGFAAIEKVDEPTLLVCPDAVSLTDGEMKDVHDAALAQCQKLKDRFTIMDVKVSAVPDPTADGNGFRNNCVGVDNLKYGAAYYPNLNTTLSYQVDQNVAAITSYKRNGVDYLLSANTILLVTSVDSAMARLQQGLADAKAAVLSLSPASTSYVTNIYGDLNGGQALITSSPTTLYTGIKNALTGAPPNLQTLVDSAKASPAGAFYTAITTYNTTKNAVNGAALITAYNTMITNLSVLRTAVYVEVGNANAAGYLLGNLSSLATSNPTLYNSIMAKINVYTVQLNPGSSMAGIYARVDADRGVWKAPANVGVRSITGPSANVTNSEQGDLNIDATSGKSINVIRAFSGRGIVVWGARTLAGNDNEWRYINVRRLFTYVEESVQEASEFVVFEPNTANTWQRVKGMIEAFLTGLWRDGALAGATTKEAFFVRVGLGTTMTADDILNGRMIIEIGMAAVRPAEFIILKFEHKLQES